MAGPAARAPVTLPVEPFSPIFSQQEPGGSLVLDRIQLQLKKVLSTMAVTINSITTAVPISPDGTAGGTGGTTFDFSSNGYEDSSGAEVWVDERMCDFTAGTSPNANLFIGASGNSASGVGALFVRTGGTPGTPDGNLIGLLFAFPGGFVQYTARRTFPNPGGSQLLKLSVKSSGAAQSTTWQAVSVRVS